MSCTACGKPVLSADLAAHMERGCNDSAAAAFGDPRTLPAAAEGHLSWLRAIQDHLCSAEPPARVPSPGPGHPSTLEAASQGSGSMRCDSPADEEYHYRLANTCAYSKAALHGMYCNTAVMTMIVRTHLWNLQQQHRVFTCLTRCNALRTSCHRILHLVMALQLSMMLLTLCAW